MLLEFGDVLHRMHEQSDGKRHKDKLLKLVDECQQAAYNSNEGRP